MTKYIIITGGVVSSIGKGITSASMGRILRSYGLKVAAIKIDPYLNWDSGTLNPYQHGEVFVTHDGMETDLDLGHYERFLDVELDGLANITTGKVYESVIAKESSIVFSSNCFEKAFNVTLPSFVYFTALESKLVRICLIRSSSPQSLTGISGEISI